LRHIGEVLHLIGFQRRDGAQPPPRVTPQEVKHARRAIESDLSALEKTLRKLQGERVREYMSKRDSWGRSTVCEWCGDGLTRDRRGPGRPARFCSNRCNRAAVEFEERQA
jgi:hypothetical protein